MPSPSCFRSVLSLALAMVVGCGAYEVPDQPIYRDFSLKQMDFPLKSGLRILIQEDHSTPLVAVYSAYNVGDAQDPKGFEGLAHFVEHLQFRTRPGGEGDPIWEYLKRTGADFNAFTAEDQTVYYQVAHKSHLPVLLQIEAWRLTGQLGGITEDEFRIEREVVRGELRQRTETTPMNKLFELLYRQLYPASHPYGKTMIGTHETISAATMEAAQAFTKKHYRPDNCTIVIAGDVDPKQVQKLIGRMPADALFGPGGPEGPAVERKYVSQTAAPEVPPVVSTEIKKEKGAVVQPMLLVGWSVPGGYRGNDALMDFAATSLNVALFDARRFTRENDDIESAGAFASPGVDGSVFVVQVTMRPGADPERVRTRVLDSIMHAWDNEMNQIMVTEGKWAYGVDLVRAAGDLQSAGLSVATYLAMTGHPAYFKERLEEVARVPPSAVRDFAYKWLRRERAATVYVVPDGEGAPSLLSGGGALKAREDKYLPGKSINLNLASMGPDKIRQIATAPGLEKLPRWKLPNGLEVVTVRRGDAPVGSVAVSIPGGDATVRPFGLATLARQFVYTKCPDHGRLQAVGADYGESAGLLSSSVFSSGFSGNLPNVLAYVGDELRCRELDDEAFMVVTPEIVKLRKKRLERVRKQPEYIAGKLMAEALYPDHPYGIVEPDIDAIARLKEDDVAGFVKTHYRPDGATAVIFGDVNDAEVKPLAEKYLGTWSGGGSTTAAPPPPPPGPSARKVMIVNRPGATQSLVRVACRVVPPSADNIAAFDLTTDIVQEEVWGLREQLGITYGVSGGIASRPGPTADLMVGGAVTTDKTGVAVRTILDVVARLAADGPDIKMFTVKRWDTAMSFATRFASAESIAAAVLSSKQMGWPLDVWNRYPDQLAEASRSTVKDVLAPCPGREVVVVVGDAAKVKPQLEDEGLTLAAASQ